MTLNESSEDYLETILVLSKELPVVRSVDIAENMGFKKSSVSVAMRNLSENGYIEKPKTGFITLTQKGKEVAERVYERHQLLSSWLMDLGIDEITALADACRLEHYMSNESFNAMKKYILEHPVKNND